MVSVELWQVLFGVASGACFLGAGWPLVRQLGDRLWARAAARDAEIAHRRATCPNRPPRGAKVVARGGWCDWCRITHDRRVPDRPARPPDINFRGASGWEVPPDVAAELERRLDTGVLRCSNLAAYAHGGVCGSCGVPHALDREVEP